MEVMESCLVGFARFRLIHPHPTRMPILGAIGLGLTIIVLKVLMGEVFAEIEKTLVLGLHAFQLTLSIASQMAAVAAP